MTHLERAIALIEESRQTHLDAIEWITAFTRLRATKKFKQSGVVDAIIRADGSAAFHRQAIKEYDFVLRVLRKARDGR